MRVVAAWPSTDDEHRYIWLVEDTGVIRTYDIRTRTHTLIYDGTVAGAASVGPTAMEAKVVITQADVDLVDEASREYPLSSFLGRMLCALGAAE